MTLMDLLLQSHQTAALNNDNASSSMVKAMGQLGERFEKAVASALLSLGGPIHGPVSDARYVIFHATDEEIKERLDDGEKIPGFGNAFFKDQIDEAFVKFFERIETEHEWVWKRLLDIQSQIEAQTGNKLYPNAAAATAVVAELMNVALGTEIQLLILGRVGAWAQQWFEASK